MRSSIRAVRLPGDRQAQSAYSAAVRAGGFVFISGIGPLDSEGRVIGEGIGAQANVTMENLSAVVAAAGGSLTDS